MIGDPRLEGRPWVANGRRRRRRTSRGGYCDAAQASEGALGHLPASRYRPGPGRAPRQPGRTPTRSRPAACSASKGPTPRPGSTRDEEVERAEERGHTSGARDPSPPRSGACGRPRTSRLRRRRRSRRPQRQGAPRAARVRAAQVPPSHSSHSRGGQRHGTIGVWSVAPTSVVASRLPWWPGGRAAAHATCCCGEPTGRSSSGPSEASGRSPSRRRSTRRGFSRRPAR